MTSERSISRPGAPSVVGRLAGLRLALSGQRVVFLHARREMRPRIRNGEFRIFNHLAELLTEMGFRIVLVGLFEPPLMRHLNRHCLHIYVGWRLAWRGRAILSVVKGYLNDHWYIDPLGHRENSSIAEKTFDPEAYLLEPALQHFQAVRRCHIRQGASTRPQAELGRQAVPKGSIAIMLQLNPFYYKPKMAVCSEAEMMRAIVAARGKRPVVIKLHPFGATPAVRRAVDEVLDPENGVHLTEANVHDVLDAADVVCTRTSGAGFEALLHRTPVVLFARADYHHCTVRVQDLSQVELAIETALARKFPYAKYVWWFLRLGLFRFKEPDFADRARVVIEDALGLTPDRTGIEIASKTGGKDELPRQRMHDPG